MEKKELSKQYKSAKRNNEKSKRNIHINMINKLCLEMLNDWLLSVLNLQKGETKSTVFSLVLDHLDTM